SLVFNLHGDLTFSSIVSGNGSLEQAGSDALTLIGANTYTGDTTISAGTLRLGNGGASGSIMGDVADSGYLVFDRSDDVIFNGIISGDGSLEQAGKGTLTLNGTNTYAGGTTISNGTLQIGNGATAGSIIGDVVDNGSLVFNRSDNMTFNGRVVGYGSLVKVGGSALILKNANQYSGGTTISAGTLQLGDGGTAGWVIGDITNNGSLVFDRSDDQIFSGIVSGSGSLEQAGKGTLFLTGPSTYTGGTTISQGVLQIGIGETNGWIAGDVVNNSALVFNRSDDVVFNGLVSGGGSLEQRGPGTLILTGNNTYTGGTTINSPWSSV